VFQDSDHEIEIQHGPSATSTSHRSELAPKKRKELTPKVSTVKSGNFVISGHFRQGVP
jgi:hypothetical protein